MYALLLAFALDADARSRADCEKDFKPSSGQSGKDVIWVPTGDSLVVKMLEMAKVTRRDRVYDLGAGDGKIAITAAKRFGANAVGIEYNPDMVRLGQCLAEAERVSNRVQIRQGDIFESDFSDATVVTLYLLPNLNLRLRPTLLDMRPGTRVVSHSFTMSEWEPDEQVSADAGQAYMWIVPAKVAGKWTFEGRRAEDTFTADLQQTFQMLSGTAGKGSAPLADAKLRGSQIAFSFPEEGGITRVDGQVEGDRITAKVTRNGKKSSYVGRRT
jgi:SAM-dependent methyltransferase